MTEPTIEELTNEINKLKLLIEEQRTSAENLNKELSDTKENLRVVREYNSQLVKSTPVIGDNGSRGLDMSSESEEQPETLDSFIDSFVQPAVKKLKETYGE